MAACAAPIVLQTPALTSVDGCRAMMARQIVARVKGEALGWDLIKVYLESQGEGDSGSVMEGLEDEENEAPQSEGLLCEWPGCPYETDHQTSLDTHLRQIHDRMMWVCPVRICHVRFGTEEETWHHIDIEHGGSSVDLPTILPERFRTFNTTELRRQRTIAETMWKLGCDGEEVEARNMAILYSVYYSRTARNYFMDHGLLNQGKDSLCRTLRSQFDKRQPGTVRLTATYHARLPEGTLTKKYFWWVLLLHQNVGPQLDKFIHNAVLGGTWCHVSHKCHWAFCLNVSHLELVLRAVNDDRTVCKNRSRANDGGCNALSSLHSHDHCLLDNPHGAFFDDEPPPPQPRPRISQERKMVGPCFNGCSTTRQWYRHPDDGTKCLCSTCYIRMYRAKRKEAGLSRWPALDGPKTRIAGPCVNGCTTTWGGGWCRDSGHKMTPPCSVYFKRAVGY